MTSATSAIAAGQDESDADSFSDAPVASVTTTHLRLAVVFLLVALLAVAATSWQLVFPEFLQGASATSFGVLTPIASNSLILGWLTIGLLGGGYLVAARAARRPLWGGRLAGVSLLLVAGGTAAGVVAVALGHNQGLEYLELPVWADAIVAVGLLVAAVVITRTVGERETLAAAPDTWYIVAGSWWAVLAFVAGSVPGLTGLNTTIQSSFAAMAFLLGGVLVLAIGLAYHVVLDLAGRPGEATPLSRLGFWSMVFVAGWIGPRTLVSGPTPDWLETIGAVFSIVLAVPVLVILVDLGGFLSGSWRRVSRLPQVRIGALAAGLLALLPIVNLAMSLRGSSAVVQFTSWKTAFELITLYGVGTLLLLAFAVHVFGGRVGATAWWAATLGLGTALVATLLGGLHQGYTWVSAANSGEFANAGMGFVNTVRSQEEWYAMRAVGVTLLAAGLLGLAVGALRAKAAGAAEETEDATGAEDAAGAAEEVAPPPPIPLRVVVQGAIGLFAVAVLAVLLVPATDAPNAEASLLGETRDFAAGSIADEGRAIYLAEGCWYCHTQQVRTNVTDVGLGPVSQPGDYANDTPALLGSQRLGPDLTHVGSRLPVANDGSPSLRILKNRLLAPRAVVSGDPDLSWSNMPSYSYLSDDELDALAQYIAALK